MELSDGCLNKNEGGSDGDGSSQGRVGMEPSIEGHDDQAINWDLHVIRRAHTFTQLEDFQQIDSTAIQCRFDMLQNTWIEFAKNCRRARSASSQSCYAEGEEAYFAASSALQKRLIEISKGTEESPATGIPNVVQVQIADTLSQTRTPTFKGDFAAWANFRDWVTTSVQRNVKLTNADRLAKLLSALEGTAKEATGSWRYSDEESFEKAWELLKKRYDNDFQTIRAHLLKVYALKPMRRVSALDVEHTLNTTVHAQRELLRLVSPEQLSNYQFLFQLEQLLDADGRREWEMRRRIDTLPTLNDMFEFLEQRRMFLTSFTTHSNTTSIASTSGSKATNEAVNRTNFGMQSNFQNRRTQPANRNRADEREGPKCFKCAKSGHGLARCDEFREMNLNDRLQLVRGQNLCHGCYSPRHATERCLNEGARCQKCAGEVHNSTICPQNSKIPATTKKEGTIAHATVPESKYQLLKQFPCSDLDASEPMQSELSIQIESERAPAERHKSIGDVWLALLATAQVRLKVGPFTSGVIRTLCDSGAQVNLIAESTVRAARLPTQQCSTRIVGLTGGSKKPLVRKVVGQLLSRFSDEPLAEIELVVMPKLGVNRLPNVETPIDMVPVEYRPGLADPAFNVPAIVNMLLGAGVWASCLQGGSMINQYGIVLQSSRLGWLIYGGGVRP